MRRIVAIHLLLVLFVSVLLVSRPQFKASAQSRESQAVLVLRSNSLAPQGQGPESRSLKLDGLFYETAQGRTMLPAELTAKARNNRLEGQTKMADGRMVSVSLKPEGAKNFIIRLSAQPATGIIKWGLAVDAGQSEYFTGLMERVVDGPQQASWAPGRQEAMNLRGQKSRHDHQAHDFDLCAILSFVARLRDVRQRRLAGATSISASLTH